MAKEVLTLSADGSIGTEMHGFAGKACLKQAAELARELQQLGIVTSLDGIQMKDTTQIIDQTQQQTVKVEGM